MELKLGTKFNIIGKKGEKYYREIKYKDGFYQIVDVDGLTRRKERTLKEINDFYVKSGTGVEIISQKEEESNRHKYIGINISSDEIGRVVAYELMKDNMNVSPYTLKVIENSVLKLLREKKIIE